MYWLQSLTPETNDIYTINDSNLKSYKRSNSYTACVKQSLQI